MSEVGSNEGTAGTVPDGLQPSGRDHPPATVAPSLVPTGLPGWASKDPLKLCHCIRSAYIELHARAKASGLALVTIETARDFTRQRYYKSIGVSKTLNSYHLPQPPHGLSLAFDVAPKDYLRIKGWHPKGPLWFVLADLGRELGLEPGADFLGMNKGWDWPHFQFKTCRCVVA